MGGSVSDSTGATEQWWWDCRESGNGAVYLGAAGPHGSLGRLVEPGSDCEASLIAALRAFAKTAPVQETWRDVIGLPRDRTPSDSLTEQWLDNPTAPPSVVQRAAGMATDLEKHHLR